MTKAKIIKLSAAILAAVAVVFAGYKLLHKNDNISAKAVPVEQAREELKDYKFGTYDNLKFDCEVSGFDKVYERLDITALCDSSKGLDTLRSEGVDILKLFFNKDIDGMLLKKTEHSNYEAMQDPDKVYDAYYCKDNELSVEVFFDNSFCIIDWLGEADPMGEGSAIIKRLRPDEITDDISYNVGGEDYRLSDAVAFTDSRLATITDKYLGGNKPVLCAAAVVHSPQADEYSYLLKYYNTYEGVRLGEIGDASPYYDYTWGKYLFFEIRHKDRFYIALNRSCEIKDKKEAENIIPLSEAEKLAADVLAQKFDVTVTECELKYVCITHYDTEERSYTPMWAFKFGSAGDAPDPDRDGYQYMVDPFEQDEFYVDAITGDYYYYQKESGRLYKNGNERNGVGEDREHEVNYDDMGA